MIIDSTQMRDFILTNYPQMGTSILSSYQGINDEELQKFSFQNEFGPICQKLAQ